MNKYKVEFNEVKTYVIDVLANSQDEATELAYDHLLELQDNGMVHYHETGDGQIDINNVYDVTNTDDPFNPLN